ncbi:MAG: hypothetical protein KGI06_01175 [Candidatus Micrarchaeota archaeon]|nr:hypothetical protein [Candidatus Micrarchaeota archaeon]
MADKGNKPGQKEASARPKQNTHTALKVFLAILAILALAVVYIVYTYASLPIALLSAGQLNQGAIEQIIMQKVNSTPELNLTYQGSVVVNNTDPGILVKMLKYHNYSRYTVTFTDFPDIGNVSTIIIPSSNGTYSCVKEWESLSQLADPRHPYVCTSVNAPSGLFDFLSLVLLSKVADISTLNNFQVTSYGISSWGGQPCYSVSGTGSIDINGALVNQTGFVPSNFSFTGCLSGQYDVPLTLNVVANAGGKFVHIDVISTGIGTSTTQSEVTSLPGNALIT